MDHSDHERDGRNTDRIDGRGHPASQRPSPSPRRPFARAAAGAMFAVLATVALTAGVGDHATTPSALTTLGPTPTALPGHTEPSDASPRQLLERFAAALTSAPADPAHAGVEYISLRVWDSFAAPPAASPDGTSPVRRTHLWTTGRASSRAVGVRSGHSTAIAGAPPATWASDTARSSPEFQAPSRKVLPVETPYTARLATAYLAV